MKMQVIAPMPGKINQVIAAVGSNVVEDEELFIMEAMKMELPITAPDAGRISEIHVTEGQAVEKGTLLAVIQ